MTTTTAVMSSNAIILQVYNIGIRHGLPWEPVGLTTMCHGNPWGPMEGTVDIHRESADNVEDP